MQMQNGEIKLKEYPDEFRCKGLHAEFVFSTIGLLYDKPYYGVTDDEIRDALSKGQLCSKLWLAEAYRCCVAGNKTVDALIVGGWIGTLSYILLQQNDNLLITSLDINPFCARSAAQINHGFSKSFAAITHDMYEYDRYEDFQVVINTSCEHIPDVRAWLDKLAKGTIVILQSNDYFVDEDHINCVSSIEEFKDKTLLSEVLYADSRNFGVYTRFMIIGKI